MCGRLWRGRVGQHFRPGVSYSQFWSRWFPDQRTEPKTQLLRLASVKNYKSYVIFELPLRFFELSPRNKEHQRLGVSRYSLVYVYCFFAQLRKFLKLRLRFPGILWTALQMVLGMTVSTFSDTPPKNMVQLEYILKIHLIEIY